MKHLTLSLNTRQAKFGLVKTALTLFNTHDCSKCKLRKVGTSPLFTKKYIARRSEDEQIIVVLNDYPYGPDAVFTDEQLTVMDAAARTVNARVEYVPIVFCAHDKTPTKLMISKCETRVKEVLEIIKPNVIICLGKGPTVLFGIEGKINKIQMGMFEVIGLPKVKGENVKLIVSDKADKIVSDYARRAQLNDDFMKAIKLCSVHSIEAPGDYYLIESPEEWLAEVDKLILRPDFILAADIETNAKPYRDPESYMRTISFCWAPGYAFCVPFELDPEGYLVGLRKLFASNLKFVWHNAVFDVAFLKGRYGLTSKNHFADTMLDAYLLKPGKGRYGYGLKGLALQYTDLGAYDTEVRAEEAEVGEQDNELILVTNEDGVEELVTAPPKSYWELIPLETLAAYNMGDVDATQQIFRIFRSELKEKGMLGLSGVMMESAMVTMEMESNGCLIDVELVDKYTPEVEAIVERYRAELKDLIGKEWDWNSPTELAKLMYHTLNYKNPYTYDDDKEPTDDTALEIINTPFTTVLRKHRKASKLCGTYLKGYFRKMESDNRLHGHFWLNETATCRLSSSDPNLQNLPRAMSPFDPGYEDLHAYKVKNLIVAPKGWVLLAADQSQAEMRVAAIMSQDPVLMKLYRDGVDIHSANAKTCFDIKVDLTKDRSDLLASGEVEGTESYNLALLKRELAFIKKNHDPERTAAKSVSFGILYGMSKWGLKFDLDGKTRAQGKVWDVEECDVLIQRFHSTYKVLSKWLDEMKQFARKNKYIYNAFGFRRPLLDVDNQDYKIRAGALRKAVNTPVQGTASLIMMLGISTALHQFDSTKVRPIMTVHDSVVLEVREDYLREAAAILEHSLTHPLFRGKPLGFINVPLVSDMESGPDYGHLKPYYDFKKIEENLT